MRFCAAKRITTYANNPPDNSTIIPNDREPKGTISDRPPKDMVGDRIDSDAFSLREKHILHLIHKGQIHLAKIRTQSNIQILHHRHQPSHRTTRIGLIVVEQDREPLL
jgi:hypothetical protein